MQHLLYLTRKGKIFIIINSVIERVQKMPVENVCAKYTGSKTRPRYISKDELLALRIYIFKT